MSALLLLIPLALILVPCAVLYQLDRYFEAKRLKKHAENYDRYMEKADAYGIRLMNLHDRRQEIQARWDARKSRMCLERNTGPAPASNRRLGRL